VAVVPGVTPVHGDQSLTAQWYQPDTPNGPGPYYRIPPTTPRRTGCAPGRLSVPPQPEEFHP